MEKIITIENIKSFSYCNADKCKKPIRAVVLFFFGLGGSDSFGDEMPEGKMYAEQGILFLAPYYNPWSWMNKQAVEYTEELFEHFNLPANTPIVSTGASMGGLSTLIFTNYAKRTPIACVANCPVCDLPYHFTERRDLPRTIYSAFGNYDCSFEDAMKSNSPLHLVDKMPKTTKYCIFHCEKDDAVNKKIHSDRFVAELKREHYVKYYEIADRGHCDLTDEMRQIYLVFIVDAIKEKENQKYFKCVYEK